MAVVVVGRFEPPGDFGDFGRCSALFLRRRDLSDDLRVQDEQGRRPGGGDRQFFTSSLFIEPDPNCSPPWGCDALSMGPPAAAP